MEQVTDADIKAAAAALGRLGGLKGGRARADKLTAERRLEIAQIASKARWGKKKKEVTELIDKCAKISERPYIQGERIIHKRLIRNFKFVMEYAGIRFEKIKKTEHFIKDENVVAKKVGRKKIKKLVPKKEKFDYNKIREFVAQKEASPVIKNNYQIVRPVAEYTQTRSPYGIADELHGIKKIS